MEVDENGVQSGRRHIKEKNLEIYMWSCVQEAYKREKFGDFICNVGGKKHINSRKKTRIICVLEVEKHIIERNFWNLYVL